MYIFLINKRRILFFCSKVHSFREKSEKSIASFLFKKKRTNAHFVLFCSFSRKEKTIISDNTKLDIIKVILQLKIIVMRRKNLSLWIFRFAMIESPIMSIEKSFILTLQIYEIRTFYQFFIPNEFLTPCANESRHFESCWSEKRRAKRVFAFYFSLLRIQRKRIQPKILAIKKRQLRFRLCFCLFSISRYFRSILKQFSLFL